MKPKKGIGRFRSRNSTSAFTLVEVMITVFLFSIILGALFLILLSGSDSWYVNSTQVEVQQESRKATEWIRQELIQSGSSTITSVPANGSWYTTITFKIATGASGGSITWSSNTIQYLLGGTGSAQLIRRSGGVDRVLAQDMQTLQFRRLSTAPNIVEVNATTRKTTPKGTPLTSSTSFEVKLRN